MKALVTGGGGFLGAALVRELLARGHEVLVLARGDYPELRLVGASTVQADVRDAEAVARACEGRDAVFHTAAHMAGVGDRTHFLAVNVEGTENVISGCRAAGVRALVYTSSPSVVANGQDIEGADESMPYPRRFLAEYPRTKAMAEQRVRASGLSAIVLRPHFIWGPGDRQLLPRLIERARAGKLRRVGRRDVKVDTIHIENCVHAHLLAADRLLSDPFPDVRVYFVSDGEPVSLWWMAGQLLHAAGAPPPRGTVPAWLAMAAGAVLETAYTRLGIAGEPLITRFAVQQMSHHGWFDISAARRDLGYEPRLTLAEGLTQLREVLAAQPEHARATP